jgi:hypothetical protein
LNREQITGREPEGTLETGNREPLNRKRNQQGTNRKGFQEGNLDLIVLCGNQ